MESLLHQRFFGGKLTIGFGAAFLAVFCQGAWAQGTEAVADPVLAKNEWVEVRKSDYEAFLSRAPEGVAGRVSNDQRAIIQVLSRLLRDKTLVAQARAEKLDQEPKAKAFLAGEIERFEREADNQDPKAKALLAAEIERFHARLRVEQIEREASEEFKKSEAKYAARAQEIYLADRRRFELPERVEAAHILFELEPRGKGEGLKLAQEIRAKIVAGEDFGKAAMQHSEDRGSVERMGDLGWFSRRNMVPEFSEAAFALKNVGDVSEPVLTEFGWHLILLKGKKEAGLMPFEEARQVIMNEQRQRFVDEYRNREIAKINDDPKAILNEEAIDALYIAPPSPERIREIIEEARSRSAEERDDEKKSDK